MALSGPLAERELSLRPACLKDGHEADSGSFLKFDICPAIGEDLLEIAGRIPRC